MEDKDFQTLLSKLSQLSTEQKEVINGACQSQESKYNVSGPIEHPRLSIFSGADQNSISYRQYKLELNDLITSGRYSPLVLRGAIRRSLRGYASDLILNLEDDASIKSIIDVLDANFDSFLPSESLLESFMSASQKPEENIMAWSLRLKSLINEMLRKTPPIVTTLGAEQILRTQFVRGLKSENIKRAVEFVFNSNESSEVIINQARIEECKQNQAGSSVFNNAISTEDRFAKQEKQIDELSKNIKSLTETIKELKSGGQQDRQQPRCYRCKQLGHIQRNCQANPRDNQRSFRGDQSNFGGNQSNFRGNQQNFRGNQSNFRGNQSTNM